MKKRVWNMMTKWTAVLMSVCLLCGVVCSAAPQIEKSGDMRAYKSAEISFVMADRAAYNDRVWQALSKGMKDMEKSIDLSSYSVTADELLSLLNRMIVSDPFLFHIKSQYNYNEGVYDGLVKEVFFDYKYSKSAYNSKVAYIEKTAGRIVSGVQPTWSDAEKALYLHDYIAANFEYDIVNHSADVYTFLAEGRGVCQAYLLLYGYLLDLVGIDNSPVISDRMNHGWNQVRIDGKYYHVDITWDDPVVDSELGLAGFTGLVNHDYFLVSDQKIREDHTGYETDYTCASTIYDNRKWSEVESSFVFLNGKWYCYRTGGIYIYDFARDAFTMEHTVNDRWEVSDRPGYYYNASYSGLSLFDDKLVYNGPNAVYSYDPANKTVRSLYVSNEIEGQIFGSCVDQSKLTCYISKSPAEYGYLKTMRLEEADGSGKKVFVDVVADDWFYSAVDYAVEHKLMSGVSDTRFAPEEDTSRAMLVQVLYNLEGNPPVKISEPFTDVKPKEWYTQAVLWAYEHHIVSGVSAREFAPEDNLSREQFAAILFRYAAYKGIDTTERAELSSYDDASKTSSYAVNALSWARAKRYITGHAGTNLIDPDGEASRAQMASILMRFAKDNTEAE
ncbi:MAG: hypothetical protein HFE78_05820 [Clostridiales bacterium]|nr:hypothetical protein [Clostridiales bacterium]